MPTKTKPVIELEHAELTHAAIKLCNTRKALEVLNGEEEVLKDRIKEILQEYEIGEATVFQLSLRGKALGVQVILTPSNGNKSLNKDMLIDAGVLPSVIEKGYKAGKPFIKVEVKIP